MGRMARTGFVRFDKSSSDSPFSCPGVLCYLGLFTALVHEPKSLGPPAQVPQVPPSLLVGCSGLQAPVNP